MLSKLKNWIKNWLKQPSIYQPDPWDDWYPDR